MILPLKNRYMHVDYMENNSQSVNSKVPKSQFDTLESTLEELVVLKRIFKNPAIKQKELADGQLLEFKKKLLKEKNKK